MVVLFAHGDESKPCDKVVLCEKDAEMFRSARRKVPPEHWGKLVHRYMYQIEQVRLSREEWESTQKVLVFMPDFDDRIVTYGRDLTGMYTITVYPQIADLMGVQND
jgi:hypothetical protein